MCMTKYMCVLVLRRVPVLLDSSGLHVRSSILTQTHVNAIGFYVTTRLKTLLYGLFATISKSASHPLHDFWPILVLSAWGEEPG